MFLNLRFDRIKCDLWLQVIDMIKFINLIRDSEK